MELKPGSENRPNPRTSQKVVAAQPTHTKFELELARQLKQTYTIERVCYESCRDGVTSEYKPSPRWDGSNPENVEGLDGAVEDAVLENVWVKVAKTLHAKGIDPNYYVRRIFSVINGKMSSPPLPSHLLSNQSLQLYRKGIVNLPKEIELAFKFQVSLSRTHILSQQSLYGRTMAEATLRVLTDRSLALSALFRYCLAFDMQKYGQSFVDLMERFKDAAAIQYTRHQAEYDRFWGSCIPDNFRGDAVKIYEGSVL